MIIAKNTRHRSEVDKIRISSRIEFIDLVFHDSAAQSEYKNAGEMRENLSLKLI
jgi:hypothetical protein